MRILFGKMGAFSPLCGEVKYINHLNKYSPDTWLILAYRGNSGKKGIFVHNKEVC